MVRSVVREKSLSGAARELGLSQPAVSMQMKALAEELGVALFEPDGRGLAPTAAGRVLAGYAERILRGVADARLAVRTGVPGSAVVRVAASSTPGVLLPERIAGFQRRRPGAVVRFEVHNSRGVEDRVASGAVDLGVIGGQRRNASLRAEHWCDDELAWIVAPGHRLAGRRSVRPEALARETLLVREAGSATRSTLEAAFLGANLALPESQVIGDTEAIKNAVMAGLGVACVSPFHVRAELAAGRLRPVRIRDLPLRRPLSILRRPGSADQAVERFLDFLRARRPRSSSKA